MGKAFTLWDRVTHEAIVALDGGLAHAQRQAIIWTNDAHYYLDHREIQLEKSKYIGESYVHTDVTMATVTAEAMIVRAQNCLGLGWGVGGTIMKISTTRGKCRMIRNE